MASEERITVEVAYAKPQEQCILAVEGPAGMTVGEALERSKITQRFPEIELQEAKVGVFGKLSTRDAVLRDGDRVEIYRPLIADPKEARKKRAGKTKPKRAAQE